MKISKKPNNKKNINTARLTRQRNEQSTNGTNEDE